MSDWPKNPFPAGKGRGGNPAGRPSGSVNKLPREVREIFLEAANRLDAADALVRLYDEDPAFRVTFWKDIMTLLLPKKNEVVVETGPRQKVIEHFLVNPSG